MIRVQKLDQTVPAGLISASAERKKKELMVEKNDHDAEGGIYAHDSVKAALNAIYGNKCAYCESLIEEQADRRVDHYRPKKARTRGEDLHPGYFWLTYEWSNLILSCSTCNGKKGNQFPVAGPRITTPPTDPTDWNPRSAPMAGEHPLLLNPEVDDPSEHLCFSPDGAIHPKNGSQRGDITIKVCKLDRDELTLNRKKWMDGFRDTIKEQVFLLVEDYKQGFYKTPDDFRAAIKLGFKHIVKKIRTAKQPNQPFSLLGQLVNQDTDHFLLETIPAGDSQEIVRAALRLL